MPRRAGIRLLVWLVVGLSCWLVLRPAEAAQGRGVPGAQIHTQDGLKNMEAVQSGERVWGVWSRDEFTREYAWRPVAAVFVTHPAEVHHLTCIVRGRFAQAVWRQPPEPGGLLCSNGSVHPQMCDRGRRRAASTPAMPAVGH